MRFFDAYCFPILGGDGVQHERGDPQVYSVLNERIDIVCAILPLESEWVNVQNTDEE